MKITLLLTGKTDKDFLQKGIEMYEKRIKRYIDFDIKTLKDIKHNKKLSIKEIKESDAKQILQNIDPNDFLIILDEKGQSFGSIDFSTYLSKKIDTGIKHIIFAVGGAYGFSETVYKKANEMISLSKMTFSHQIIRLLFVEQLYRAFTIIKGEPYHNE
jgi:23S rRNA (pseudouridine1915-N3)-methyltransferase